MGPEPTGRAVVVLAKMHLTIRGGSERIVRVKHPRFMHCEVPRASAGPNVARTSEVNRMARETRRMKDVILVGRVVTKSRALAFLHSAHSPISSSIHFPIEVTRILHKSLNSRVVWSLLLASQVSDASSIPIVRSITPGDSFTFKPRSLAVANRYRTQRTRRTHNFA